MDYYLRLAGAENSAFGTIVAADERASLPHARPTDKIITPHSAVLFDWGACCQSYCSDLTRVVFLGKIPPLLKKLYRIVAEAQQRAIDLIKPGLPIGRLDKTARAFIQKKGYGKYFGHGLGHGIGRQGHEAPRLKGNKNKLQPGMVMTIEPGIYLPGQGGIRIEDMVLVTETGCELLTASVPKKLEEMVL
ncbi:MAG: M24 family metallopeptidase [Planctomycetota bacterium]